jgi:hypothetical protein
MRSFFWIIPFSPRLVCDLLVFSGIQGTHKWIAGSESFLRTDHNQAAWPAETADANTVGAAFEDVQLRSHP